LSVTDAAKILGIGRPAFSNVINGNACLSIALALALQSKFDMNAKKLLIAQLNEQFEEALGSR
jgi:plasmid maintenance system antidote protein VapI